MRSVLWKTFGLSAPILVGLLGFSSPSEKLVGGRVDAVVCGDVVSLFCGPSRPLDQCQPFTKWGDANVDPTDDDYYERDPYTIYNCATNNPGTGCLGMGDAPKQSSPCIAQTTLFP